MYSPASPSDPAGDLADHSSVRLFTCLPIDLPHCLRRVVAQDEDDDGNAGKTIELIAEDKSST